MNRYINTLLPPDRKFGLFIATVLAVLASYAFLKNWASLIQGIAVALSLLALLVALMCPSVLGPMNSAWFYVGAMMGRIVNPLVMGVIFFGLLTPVALIGRLFGRDELELKRHSRGSYWRHRTHCEFDLDSFKRQF